MQYALAIALLLPAAARAACDASVSGHLTDEQDHLPIPDARIELGDRVATSAEDGRFVFREVCDGPATLHVHHPAYLGLTATITVPVEHLDLELEQDIEVVVAEVREPHGPKAQTTLSGAALEQTRGLDLGESIEGVAGVTLLRTSTDATRPMVRGLFGRRLLLLYQGMRHETQKWGTDHAPEIDPLSAGRITVTRGPSGLRFGPDAIGGVVAVSPPPLRKDAGVGGRLDMVANSNGKRGLFGLAIDVANGKGLATRIEANLGKGSALRSPTYVLGNTASQTSNAALSFGWTPGRFELEAGVRHHAFEAGICTCLRSGSPEELRLALMADRPLNSENWTPDPDIERPRQSVHHTWIFARAAGPTPLGKLELSVNTQINRREEFDTVRGSVEGSQFDFTLRTTTLDARLDHEVVHLSSYATLSGEWGASARLQDNLFRGLPLVPNHRAASAGAFVIERVSIGHGLLEAGARMDTQSRATFLSDTAFAAHQRRNTLTEGDCEDTGNAHRCGLGWTTGSFSIGGLWHDSSERLELRLDASSATRFPDGDELYLNGAAPTQPVFGLGNPSLKPETTTSLSPTVAVDLTTFRAELSAYASRLDNTILFRPVLTEAGQPAIDQTVQGSFARYQFTQTATERMGAEAMLAWDLHPWVSTTWTGMVTRAQERTTGAPVPFVPADRFAGTLALHPPRLGKVEGSRLSVTVQAVSRQKRWDGSTDLGPPPAGYAVVHAGLDVPISLGEQTLDFGLQASNLTNARVRSYTSLLRYFADEPGRDIRARLSFRF